ncbi:MAG: hypothetical protein JWQ90_2565 [Hydrocarboniphaga sp.]|uniref:DUF3375 family protein n=1 Tax=Hydrocarboniphaga sp. TaxID=2033016 RepID=UPI00261550E8|nr:DUF3375 family protein [Hydrocarboniphaga sp.]MDB5970115.1 hypothetical protein [Hydrocarboniphaga sp.]
MLKVQERHRHYQWLRDDRTAWRLLRADTAPLILAFLGELFSEVTEVSIDRAKTELEIYLSKHGSGEAGPAVAARSFINQWVNANYLREQSQKLTMTSVTQTALQFVESIGRRDMMVTASHLETVNQEMGRLLVELSPDIGERSRLLEEQIDALEKAKKRLLEGHVEELTRTQKRERVRHLYTLAASLSQDFRLLEEEMRLHEIAIRQKVLEEQDSRGDVLVSILDAEDQARPLRGSTAPYRRCRPLCAEECGRPGNGRNTTTRPARLDQLPERSSSQQPQQAVTVALSHRRRPIGRGAAHFAAVGLDDAVPELSRDLNNAERHVSAQLSARSSAAAESGGATANSGPVSSSNPQSYKRYKTSRTQEKRLIPRPHRRCSADKPRKRRRCRPGRSRRSDGTA